jgi:large subunit ribosomal protein L25
MIEPNQNRSQMFATTAQHSGRRRVTLLPALPKVHHKWRGMEKVKQAAAQVYKLTTNFRSVEGSRRCAELREKRNRIPGVVYGGPGNQNKILVHQSRFDVASLVDERKDRFSTTLVDVRIEDEFDPKGKEVKTFRCVPRSILLHHAYDYPMTCNWLIYNPERGLKVNLPILIEDREKCAGLKKGAVLNRVFWTLPCFVKGPTLPDGIRVSVAGLNVNDKVRWSDVDWKQLPEGVSIECLMFRKPGLAKAGVKNLTLVSVEGGRSKVEDEEKKTEESLEKF